MGLNDWKNLASSMSSPAARNAESAGIKILLILSIFLAPYYWWQDYKKEEAEQYLYGAVYYAQKSSITYPKQLYVGYQEDPIAWDKIYKGTDKFIGITPSRDLTKDIEGYYKYSYKDLNDDGLITQNELDMWEKDENYKKNHKINMKDIKAQYPHLKDVFFEGYSYFMAQKVASYAKEFPTTLQYLRDQNKDDPDNLQRLLIHGLMESGKRRNQKGYYSDYEMRESNLKWSNGLNIWVKI